MVCCTQRVSQGKNQDEKSLQEHCGFVLAEFCDEMATACVYQMDLSGGMHTIVK